MVPLPVGAGGGGRRHHARGRPRRLLAYALLGVVLAAPFWSGLPLLRRASHLAYVWSTVAFHRSPDAVLTALQASGPVFVKLAQWASTRRDILSDELCDAMGTLHDQVLCASSPEDLREAERKIPGLTIDGPLLGGGCIAQVYAGTLQAPPTSGKSFAGKSADGRSTPVAVKVRRQEVPRLLETDLKFLRWAARLVQSLRPGLRWLDLPSAVDNFGWYLRQQVNLSIEAIHTRRFAENFKRGAARFPRVLAATDSVLVTTLAPGVPLTKFVRQHHPEVVRKAVFELLTDLMAKMILRHNFIHGDLHPGNIFVSLAPATGLLRAGRGSVKPTLTLIDTGIAIELTANMTKMVRRSMLAALRMDPLGLGKALITLHQEEGLGTHARDIRGLEHKVGHLLLCGCFMVDEDIWGTVFAKWEDYNGTRVSEYFTMMLSFLSEHRVRVSPSLWSLMTAFALIEGSVAELGYGINVLMAAIPYLFRPMDLLGRFHSWVRLATSHAKHMKEMPNYPR